MTEYVPRFIDGITIDEINAELKDMAYRQYAYCQSQDKLRVWDLEHTRKILEEGKKC